MASLSRWMKIRAIGSVLAGVSTFMSSIFVLSRIPICAPPPPPGDAVLGYFVHDLASVLAPLGVMIATIGGCSY